MNGPRGPVTRITAPTPHSGHVFASCWHWEHVYATSTPFRRGSSHGCASARRAEQYTSAVTLGELYKAAYRSRERDRHLENIEQRVLPALTVLPYERSAARVFGRIRADLEERGAVLPDADLQIAAIALYHGLELVTGNQRIPGLRVNRALADARQG
jgi:predicted nucleic acid-binding protein